MMLQLLVFGRFVGLLIDVFLQLTNAAFRKIPEVFPKCFLKIVFVVRVPEDPEVFRKVFRKCFVSFFCFS